MVIGLLSLWFLRSVPGKVLQTYPAQRLRRPNVASGSQGGHLLVVLLLGDHVDLEKHQRVVLPTELRALPPVDSLLPEE